MLPSDDDDDSWRLRGCIGTFTHKPLLSGLREYAITSGLHDHRFNPITAEEISKLRCDVSLLHEFEHNLSAYDWTVGMHGIIIEFTDSHSTRTYSATYLPEVAAEQNWTQQETIVELMYKSGYRHKCSEQIISSINLTRYKSSKSSCTYQQYQSIKQQYRNNNTNKINAAQALQ